MGPLDRHTTDQTDTEPRYELGNRILSMRKQTPSFFCDCTSRFGSDLVGNPEDRFSRPRTFMVVNNFPFY